MIIQILQFNVAFSILILKYKIKLNGLISTHNTLALFYVELAVDIPGRMLSIVYLYKDHCGPS